MINIVLAVGFLFVIFSGEAEAKRHRHPVQVQACMFFCDNPAYSAPAPEEGRRGHRYKSSPRYHFGDGIGPRPSRWCGWFMQQDTGVTSKVTGRNLNMAREWRHVGQATSAGIGAIVVWAHHVGRIVGGSPGAWVVRSGNDGRAVRERVRSVANAIAFRSI